MKKQNKAFTLVELIVVITILAILWTIAFISLQWYSSQARDSKRLSDIQNIKKSLELFSLNTWKYPLPDTWVEYSFSWELLWTQWIVWDQVSINLSRNLNEKPLDPLSETEYVYSVTNTQTQFEILWLYESDLIWTNIGANLVFAQQSNAATQDYAKISWTYNWIYVKSPSFIFPTPSIINALNTEIDFNTNSWAIQSQVITWWDNNIWLWTWALSDLTMTYTWVINNNSSDAEKISVIETLQNFYSGTSLSSIDEIADLLSKTSDDEKKDLAEFLVLNSWVVSVSSWDWDEYNMFESDFWTVIWWAHNWWVNARTIFNEYDIYWYEYVQRYVWWSVVLDLWEEKYISKIEVFDLEKVVSYPLTNWTTLYNIKISTDNIEWTDKWNVSYDINNDLFKSYEINEQARYFYITSIAIWHEHTIWGFRIYIKD